MCGSFISNSCCLVQAIQHFIDYLEEWENEAKLNNYKFIPDNTYYGLKISLENTLKLMDFLHEKCNYEYLMTARLNQDALEVIEKLKLIFT